MRKIVIGYDGSECSENVLLEVPRMGLPEELTFHVVHVADVWFAPDGDPSSRPEGDEGWPDNVREARKSAFDAVRTGRKIAQHGASKIRSMSPEWDARAISTAGPPARVLLNTVEATHADLLVVGSHARSALGRFFMGSVARMVVQDAPCSVHVCRPGPGGGSVAPRVMLALDGSSSSEDVLRMLEHRIWPEGTVLEAVGVLDPKVDLKECAHISSAHQSVNQHDAHAGEWLGRVMDHAKKSLANQGWTLETRVLEGDPAHQLLKHAEAWRADCIVMGAQGLQHGPTRPLGTLAGVTINQAHCSVEIVRPRPAKRRLHDSGFRRSDAQ